MRVRCRCLARTPGELPTAGIRLLHYTPRLSGLLHTLARTHLLLDEETDSTVSHLLTNGIERVYVGDAALADPSLMPRLIQQFGAARLGLHVRARRQAVNWAFDTESNADFNVVTPSLCVPQWEVLRSDGGDTGILVQPWLHSLHLQGVSSAVLRVDIRDDADLNLCAGMVESFGDLIWFAPMNEAPPSVADWIEFGQVRQLALPPAMFHRREAWMPKAGEAA